MFNTLVNLLAIFYHGYDLRLISELPSNHVPRLREIYLEKQGEQLRYLVMKPSGEIVDDMLNISVEGVLTTEDLHHLKNRILLLTSSREHTIYSNNMTRIIDRVIAEEPWYMDDENTSFINLALITPTDANPQKKDLSNASNKDVSTLQRDVDWHDLHVNAAERIYENKAPIELHNLFKSQPADKQKTCTKVQLLGAAGSGKSTLLQRIAHDWASHQEGVGSSAQILSSSSDTSYSHAGNNPFYLPNHETPYRLVLWIKLRAFAAYLNLDDVGPHISDKYRKRIEKTRKPYDVYAKLNTIKTLARYLVYQMSNISGGQVKLPLSAKDIYTLLKNNRDNILVLLDGYDEIATFSNTPDNKHPIHDMVEDWLFNWPHLIVTSRPYVDIPLPIWRQTDFRRVELLGFKHPDCLAYLERHFVGKTTAPDSGYSELKTLLTQNTGIRGIAHIPVNLEILCTLISRDGKRALSDLSQVTTTQIYQKLMVFLLRRYREKNFPTELAISQHTLLDEQSLLLFAHESGLLTTLGELALQGLINKRLQFSADEMRAKVHVVCSSSPHLKPKDVYHKLFHVGLFRGLSWDYAQLDIEGAGEFLHLTLQEFLAALYFSLIWQKNNLDTLIGVMDKDNKPYTLRGLIYEYKYHPTFAMVWPFVAGLVALDTGISAPTRLDMFAAVLNTPPIELKGMHHEPLLLRCMEQIPDLDRLPQSWQDLSTVLAQGYQIQNEPTMAILLGSWSSNIRLGTIRAIECELTRSPRWVATKLLPYWSIALTQGDQDNILNSLRDITRLDAMEATLSLLNPLARQLASENVNICKAALDLIDRLGAIAATEPFLTQLITMYASKDVDIRLQIMIKYLLSKLGGAAVTEHLLPELANMLASVDVVVCIRALGAMAHFGTAVAKEPLLNLLALQLTNPCKDICEAALSTLSELGTTAVTELILTQLAKNLASDDTTICKMALEALGSLGTDAAIVLLNHLVNLLMSEDEDTSYAALYTLRRLGAAKIKEPLLTLLANQLANSGWHLRNAVLDILGVPSATIVTESLIIRLVEQVSSPYYYIQEEAFITINKLGPAVVATELFLTRLAEQVANPDGYIRSKASRAIIKLGAVVAREPLLTILAYHLNSEKPDICEQALLALEGLGTAVVTETVLTLLAQSLERKHDSVCKAALNVLEGLGAAAATEFILGWVYENLLSEDEGMVITALWTLSAIGPAAAIEPLLSLLIQQLTSENKDIQWALLHVIARLGAKIATEPFLTFLARHLANADKDIFMAALRALNKLGPVAIHACSTQIVFSLNYILRQDKSVLSFVLTRLQGSEKPCNYIRFIDADGGFIEDCAVELSLGEMRMMMGHIQAYRTKQHLLPIADALLEAPKPVSENNNLVNPTTTPTTIQLDSELRQLLDQTYVTRDEHDTRHEELAARCDALELRCEELKTPYSERVQWYKQLEASGSIAQMQFAEIFEKKLQPILVACFILRCDYVGRARQTRQEMLGTLVKFLLESVSFVVSVAKLGEFFIKGGELFHQTILVTEFSKEFSEAVLPEHISVGKKVKGFVDGVKRTVTGDGQKRAERVGDFGSLSEIEDWAFYCTRLITETHYNQIALLGDFENNVEALTEFAEDIVDVIVFALKDGATSGKRIITDRNDDKQILLALAAGDRVANATLGYVYEQKTTTEAFAAGDRIANPSQGNVYKQRVTTQALLQDSGMRVCELQTSTSDDTIQNATIWYREDIPEFTRRILDVRRMSTDQADYIRTESHRLNNYRWIEQANGPSPTAQTTPSLINDFAFFDVSNDATITISNRTTDIHDDEYDIGEESGMDEPFAEPHEVASEDTSQLNLAVNTSLTLHMGTDTVSNPNIRVTQYGEHLRIIRSKNLCGRDIYTFDMTGLKESLSAAEQAILKTAIQEAFPYHRGYTKNYAGILTHLKLEDKAVIQIFSQELRDILARVCPFGEISTQTVTDIVNIAAPPLQQQDPIAPTLEPKLSEINAASSSFTFGTRNSALFTPVSAYPTCSSSTSIPRIVPST